jgi:hypothetical protein
MTQNAPDTIGTRIGIPYVNLQLRAEPWVLSIKVNSRIPPQSAPATGRNLVAWMSLRTHGGERNRGRSRCTDDYKKSVQAPLRRICPA